MASWLRRLKLKLWPPSTEEVEAMGKAGIQARLEGKHVEAISIFEDMRSVAPSDPYPYIQLAICYALLGRMDLARQEYRKAAARCPDGKPAPPMVETMKGFGIDLD